MEQGPDVSGPIPALLGLLLFFPNTTRIESQQFINLNSLTYMSGYAFIYNDSRLK